MSEESQRMPENAREFPASSASGQAAPPPPPPESIAAAGEEPGGASKVPAGFGYLVGIVALIAILGCIHAFQGRYYELPLIYGVVKQYI